MAALRILFQVVLHGVAIWISWRACKLIWVLLLISDRFFPAELMLRFNLPLVMYLVLNFGVLLLAVVISISSAEQKDNRLSVDPNSLGPKIMLFWKIQNIVLAVVCVGAYYFISYTIMEHARMMGTPR